MDSKFLTTPEYEFLKTNPRLGRNIILLTAGGSHAYGTNREGSDIDLRGVVLQQPSDLIGRTHFEHYVDNNTDTTLYAFNKFIQLASDGNPNVIEILGCRPEEIFYASSIGNELIQNVDMFISQHIATKIAGFATEQLRRIQAAIARKSDQKTQEEYMLNACNRRIKGFNERYPTLCANSSLKLSLEVFDGVYKICCTGEFDKVPLGEMKGAYDDLVNIHKSFHKFTGNNKKKDDEHLNKHAYHLVRLLMMGKEILDDGVIRTYRDKEHDLLMEIRDGKYMESGVFIPEFFEYIDHLDAEFKEAQRVTTLPRKPDAKRIDGFVERVNRMVVTGEF